MQKINYMPALGLLMLALLVVALVTIPIQYMAGHGIQGLVTNSDLVYVQVVLTDILANNGELKDWYLSPSPYFFPDFLIFLPAYLIGSTAFIQIGLFSLFQAMLVFVAVWFLAKQLPVSSPFFVASVTTTSLIWLALTSGDPFVYLVTNGCHYGILLIAIFFMATWLKYGGKDEGQSKLAFYLLVSSLAFFAVLSDTFFLVQLIAPLIATTVFISIVQRDFSLKNKLPLVATTVFGIIGFVSYYLIVANHTRYPKVPGLKTEKFFINLNDIYELFYRATIDKPFFGVIFLLYLGVVLRSLFQLIMGTAKSKELQYLIIFSFAALCASITVISLLAYLSVTGRYLIAALSWPVIVVFIFFSHYLAKRFVPIAVIISLLAVAHLSWNSYQLVKRNGISATHYPSKISCIDDVLERENVANGIAEYWDANYLETFSRLDLNIAQHSSDLKEFRWVTTKKAFKESYDFAIIAENQESTRKISHDALVRINGKPRSVDKCEDKTIYVYGKNQLRVK